MLSQEKTKEIFIPLLKQSGKLYQKKGKVYAREITNPEIIQTITSDGVETINQGEVGDFVIQNQTDAKEEYIIKSDTFCKKYAFLRKLNNGFSEYKAIGKTIAIEINKSLAKDLMLSFPFQFTAPWGSEMICKENDFLVCPPDQSEVYRIARKEFFETYELEETPL